MERQWYVDGYQIGWLVELPTQSSDDRWVVTRGTLRASDEPYLPSLIQSLPSVSQDI